MAGMVNDDQAAQVGLS
ncbi:hypothetical protein R3I94_020457 [Phoxinus phoxinus]|uniref:Uncharacterized protein n=1 Tax=Phoxinus phoxinus TaxID=58324 RepID=A0AAN9CAB2_9TELE